MPYTDLNSSLTALLVCLGLSWLWKTRSVLSYITLRIKGWKYLTNGADMISQEYTKANGGTFLVPGPDVNHVFVTSPQHIREIRKASEDELSLFAATKTMFQPAYTMLGHNWFDIRGAEGVGYVKAVGSLLPHHLQQILPQMRQNIKQSFDMEVRKGSLEMDGATTIRGSLMIKQVINRLNGLCFFGKELAENDDFMQTTYEYNELVITSAEILRLLPTFAKRIIGPILERRHGVQDRIFRTIEAVVVMRLEHQHRIRNDATTAPLPHDLITWVIKTAPKELNWTSRRITYEIVTIWFGSVHALSATTTFALFDLCLHKEYMEPLRTELAGEEFNSFMQSTRGLPLMDSFIKESTRRNPLEAMAGRRQALKDFYFSDGTLVKKGDWTCVPTKAILNDEAFYTDAKSFHGFRFVPPEKLPGGFSLSNDIDAPSRLADISPHYHSWGIAGITCPGRFFVSVTIKLVLAHILESFDCALVEDGKSHSFNWRSYVLPKDNVLVRFLPRHG